MHFRSSNGVVLQLFLEAVTTIYSIASSTNSCRITINRGLLKPTAVGLPHLSRELLGSGDWYGCILLATNVAQQSSINLRVYIYQVGRERFLWQKFFHPTFEKNAGKKYISVDFYSPVIFKMEKTRRRISIRFFFPLFNSLGTDLLGIQRVPILLFDFLVKVLIENENYSVFMPINAKRTPPVALYSSILLSNAFFLLGIL